MDQKLKERLVGAAVLVAIAVIFIPIIFNDAPETETITGSNIPEKPETSFNSRIVPIVETAEDFPSEPVEAEITANQENQENQNNNETADTPQIAPEIFVEKIETLDGSNETTVSVKKPDVGLSAWIVQLGSFTSEENAQSLKEKLREAGYPAFVEPLKKNGQTSYRVRVGPEIKRSDAEALLKGLQDKMKLDGIVVAYP